MAEDRDKRDAPSGPELSLVPSGEHSDEQAPGAEDEVVADELDLDEFGLDPEGRDEEEPADHAAADADGDGDGDANAGRTALPPKMDAWRRRSATGAILTGFALGLQQVFEKEKEEPAIVMQTSGDPPRDLPVEAEVERARPRQSVVNIRPWLLGGNESGSASAGQGDSGGEEDPGDS